MSVGLYIPAKIILLRFLFGICETTTALKRSLLWNTCWLLMLSVPLWTQYEGLFWHNGENIVANNALPARKHISLRFKYSSFSLFSSPHPHVSCHVFCPIMITRVKSSASSHNLWHKWWCWKESLVLVRQYLHEQCLSPSLGWVTGKIVNGL